MSENTQNGDTDVQNKKWPWNDTNKKTNGDDDDDRCQGDGSHKQVWVCVSPVKAALTDLSACVSVCASVKVPEEQREGEERASRKSRETGR